jgi:PAS domain S-box-containing protein
MSGATARQAPPNALAERIKELNCLYGISNLLENQGVSLPWIMERAVALIPAAWQYPENACACIQVDGECFTSAGFRPTPWCQRADIVLNGRNVGFVAVHYLTAPSGEEPFLEEEERLLAAIAERLSKVLWLKNSETALKESEARYRVLTEQVAEGVALIQDGRFGYVNPAFRRLFGIAPSATLVGSPVGRRADPITGEIVQAYAFLAQGHPGDRLERLERIPSDGRTTWLQVAHTPITFQGRPALLSTFKDITALKEEQMAAERRAVSLGRENQALRSSLKDRYRLGDILGRSAAMQEIYALILRAAATDASVAVYGESGTGKELVARAIHANSQRQTQRFVAVNCGAVQESLFEREFFGHLKGAFSGAHANSPGYLDLAAGGTLFLDEVSHLTSNMQVKLLRAIEGGGYRPVGATETRRTDLRIVSASNADLGAMAAAGEMREDFFYRIQVIQIRLPPLRARREDIPLLVEHFLEQMRGRFGAVRVPGHVMDLLADYDWPGNVRELRNVLQRYATLGQLEFLRPGRQDPQVAAARELRLPEAIRQTESALIARALQMAQGNRTRAARLLGISRRALFRKLHGLPVPFSPISGQTAQPSQSE